MLGLNTSKDLKIHSCKNNTVSNWMNSHQPVNTRMNSQSEYQKSEPWISATLIMTKQDYSTEDWYFRTLVLVLWYLSYAYFFFLSEEIIWYLTNSNKLKGNIHWWLSSKKGFSWIFLPREDLFPKMIVWVWQLGR